MTVRTYPASVGFFQLNEICESLPETLVPVGALGTLVPPLYPPPPPIDDPPPEDAPDAKPLPELGDGVSGTVSEIVPEPLPVFSETLAAEVVTEGEFETR